ncbi:MAG TPA: prepilin-type N-terminal cleavage/methylation domain-containing protein [Candidatus Acidoferrum sp.]|nr:prepilin-type N-terminal cleavage/methylation domain-containing protein [Candidatus Acidoferrum sp.]
MKKHNSKGKNKGFSLVELIVVVAIMAVLTAVLAPQYIKYVENSRKQSDASAVSEVIHAAEISLADNTVYEGLPASDLEIEVSDASVTCTAYPELATEILTVVAAPELKSKAYSAETYTIEIDYDTDYKVAPYADDNWSTTP